ncbi:MAG: RecX family transcriptional regulator [Bacillales bacterium]|jgi:hypothetical protein|nr:RecX family transcriptional regulator [Bacillales bacterium]
MDQETITKRLHQHELLFHSLKVVQTDFERNSIALTHLKYDELKVGMAYAKHYYQNSHKTKSIKYQTEYLKGKLKLKEFSYSTIETIIEGYNYPEKSLDYSLRKYKRLYQSKYQNNLKSKVQDVLLKNGYLYADIIKTWEETND